MKDGAGGLDEQPSPQGVSCSINCVLPTGKSVSKLIHSQCTYKLIIKTMVIYL